jgi:hypothetical protein
MHWCTDLQVLRIGFYDEKETAQWSSEDRANLVKTIGKIGDLVCRKEFAKLKYLEMYYEPAVRDKVYEMRASDIFRRAIEKMTARGVVVRRTTKKNVKCLF